MSFAVQVMTQDGGRRSTRRWLTLATCKRYSVAESILNKVRMDRKHVLEVSRIVPFRGPVAKAYHLAATVGG